MARLILEEGGATRRFKLSSGKLTFGSGDAATLTLDSDDVAELHGQIEMTDDGAVIRTAKGVMPATVAGRPVQGAHTMRSGEAVTIGSAKITVEYDEGEGPQQAASPVVSRARSGGASRSGASSRRRSSRDRGGDDEREERGGRRPRRKSTGIPGWVTAGLVLAVVGGLGYMLYSQMVENTFDFDAKWSRYQRETGEDEVKARDTLMQIAALEELSPEQRKLVEEEIARTKPRTNQLSDAKRNSDIQEWVDARLISFYDKWPVAKERPFARVFMKRANWFIEEYPTHHERDRILRYIERVKAIAQMPDPSTVEDLEREVWGEIAPSPKDFTEAIRVIDAFLAAGPSAEDKAEAERIRAETLTTEKEWYDEQVKNAAVVYDRARYPDKYEPNTAFNDMLIAVASMYTPELRADAASRMLGIREIKPSYWEAYKINSPARWEQLMTEPSLREFAQQKGLLD